MPKAQKKAPAIQYAYDSDVGELIVYFPENNTYVYRNVSPYHVREFKRLRNMGKAMNWLKEMGFEYYLIKKK